MGMKSYSTTSLASDLEKEDRIRELEILLDDQRMQIEKQNQRIRDLERVQQQTEKHTEHGKTNGFLHSPEIIIDEEDAHSFNGFIKDETSNDQDI